MPFLNGCKAETGSEPIGDMGPRARAPRGFGFFPPRSGANPREYQSWIGTAGPLPRRRPLATTVTFAAAPHGGFRDSDGMTTPR